MSRQSTTPSALTIGAAQRSPAGGSLGDCSSTVAPHQLRQEPAADRRDLLTERTPPADSATTSGRHVDVIHSRPAPKIIKR